MERERERWTDRDRESERERERRLGVCFWVRESERLSSSVFLREAGRRARDRECVCEREKA